MSAQQIRIWQAVYAFLFMFGGLWLLGYHLVTDKPWLEVLRYNWGASTMVVGFGGGLIILVRAEWRGR